MSLALRNAWQPASQADALPGHMGVFELADAQGRVLYLGFAGGRSQFGLRSSVAEGFALLPAATQFRIEVNTSYWTRYQELAMLHQAAGRSPQLATTNLTFGTLSPLEPT